MASRFLVIGSILLPVVGFAACATVDESAPSSEDESQLIGGRVADVSELPATMLIKGNCTVAKVGPRHILTAAHCVTGNNTSKFAPDAKIQVTSAKGVGGFADAGVDASSPWREHVIEKTEVEPAWRDKCASPDIKCINVNVCGRSDIADVAVIITRDEIVDIPEAAVDLAPVASGDRVVVTGYGCEGRVGSSWNYANQRLKVAETEAIPFDRVIHSGSFIYPEDRDTGLVARMAGIYNLTPGPTDPGAPDAGDVAGRGGLCPGDSGGPLYRVDKGTAVIVGVNANYTFATGRTAKLGDGTERTFNFGGSPVTNWHTRLDSKSGRGVGAWLRGLGVKTACTRGACE